MGSLRKLTPEADLEPSNIGSPDLQGYSIPVALPAALLEDDTSRANIEEVTQYYDGMIPVAFETTEGEQAGMEVVEVEDDDPEEAFYRDLRRQEEERLRRLASRRRLGN
jgi:hypothetical protein